MDRVPSTHRKACFSQTTVGGNIKQVNLEKYSALLQLQIRQIEITPESTGLPAPTKLTAARGVLFLASKATGDINDEGHSLEEDEYTAYFIRPLGS